MGCRRYFQEGRCIRKSCAAIGGQGVFDAGNLSDRNAGVDKLTADEIANEPCIGFKCGQIGGGDEEFTAGEQLGR